MTVSNICLIAKSPTYGAAAILSTALKSMARDVISVFYESDPLWFNKLIKGTIYWSQRAEACRAIAKANHLIFVGSYAFYDFFDKIRYEWRYGLISLNWRSICVVLTDTHYLRFGQEINKLIRDTAAVVYAMPDLIPFCNDLNPIPYYPPASLKLLLKDRKIDRDSYRHIIMAHSPRLGRNVVNQGGVYITRKGTELIQNTFEAVCRRYKHTNYDIITGVPLNECIIRKAKSHIFVDQLIAGNAALSNTAQVKFGKSTFNREYEGGLGKSGLEAMLCGCFVLTSGRVPDTDKYFPPPPVCWVNASNFEENLCRALDDRGKLRILAENQRSWAQSYLGFEFITKHITSHMES